MPSFSLRRFSEPETLKAIDPSILIAFLRPFAGYLQRRALHLPDSPTDDFDYQHLCRVLLNPDESVPTDMVDALYYVHELSDEEGMDTLLDYLERHRVKIEIGSDRAPADVAMLVWLKDPDILKRQHAKGYAFRPHRFEHYRSRTRGVAPSGNEGLLISLQDHLDEWFEKRKRGRGCQIFTFESGDRLWIVIRHGEPFKREGSIRGGKSASEYFRPEKYDVLIYETSTGTIAVNAKGIRLTSQYLYAVGVFFFGDGAFFPLKHEVTLTPLLQLGAQSLNFEDFPHIEDIKLVEITNVRAGIITDVSIKKSKDMFGALAMSGQQLPVFGQYTSAVLKFTARDRLTPGTVTLRPPHIVSYSRNEDREIMEPFLRARGFMPGNPAPAPHESLPVLADA